MMDYAKLNSKISSNSKMPARLGYIFDISNASEENTSKF